ncbi:hypothetical protein PV04_09917 [Phialophora macrospora]|uniref:Uncharacterized protein n=1 Tax=Phialophora macrospora TaxID=1851006 RepID=A0A0D2F598_9EURO|nr:hypothetical protein PV04_09917 [Phialophora macrospora]
MRLDDVAGCSCAKGKPPRRRLGDFPRKFNPPDLLHQLNACPSTHSLRTTSSDLQCQRRWCILSLLNAASSHSSNGAGWRQPHHSTVTVAPCPHDPTLASFGLDQSQTPKLRKHEYRAARSCLAPIEE